MDIRRITNGPRFHWFGYYDKLQFDPPGRRVLGMEVDFEHRSPTANDRINLGVIDLADDDRWRQFGTSIAWGWQQGCMLQWLPGSDSTVIWNDREADRYVSRVLDLDTGQQRMIPWPVYTVCPDGRWAVTPDFRRINHLRPGYGYAGLPDPNHDVQRPDNVGIWRVDLGSGEAELVITIAQAAAVPNERHDMSGARHYFNHLLYSPEGSRFIFLHRWKRREAGRDSFQTRMFTAAADGSDLRVVDDGGHTSHFIWRDERHILAWARRPEADWAFYVFDALGERPPEPIGKNVMSSNGRTYLPGHDMSGDGHCTYLPGNEWIVNDGYPDADRNQPLYLYHVPTGRRIELGKLYTAPEYAGEWRCDLHPRHSPDGKTLCVDSAHEGLGRQLYLIDLRQVLSRK